MFNTIVQFIKTRISFILELVNIKNVITSTEQTIPKIGVPTKKMNKIKKEDIKIIKVKKSKWKTNFPFTFFYGNNKFQPLYFWIFVFCILAAAMLFVKIYAAWLAVKKGTFVPDMISTADLGVVLGFVSSLVLLYNNNKKNIISEDIDNTQSN